MDDLADKLRYARSILETAIDLHKPKHIFGLFSGGHDSVTVTHFVARALREYLCTGCNKRAEDSV